tara:strand:+ start:327 stop:572 length:246 start_codon:yes stop_codon:yes gene_type:complete
MNYTVDYNFKAGTWEMTTWMRLEGGVKLSITSYQLTASCLEEAELRAEELDLLLGSPDPAGYTEQDLTVMEQAYYQPQAEY